MMGMNWPAMLLASALAAGAAQAGMGQVPGGRPVFDVTAYGAKRDGSAPATEAFARAIAAAKAAGGGTVYVPAGHYQSGPIELVSHLRLEFDAGAVVAFPAQMLPLTRGAAAGSGDADAGAADRRTRPGRRAGGGPGNADYEPGGLD